MRDFILGMLLFGLGLALVSLKEGEGRGAGWMLICMGIMQALSAMEESV